MKIYFEAHGADNEKGVIYLTAYIRPQKDGSGCCWDECSKLWRFKWTHPERARVFDSKELPRELLYAIRHGNNRFLEVPKEKEDNYTLDDIQYYKVDRKQTALCKKLERSLDKVQTIDDFRSLLPLIKQYRAVSSKMVNVLFGLVGIDKTPAYNGELGIAFLHDAQVFLAICSKMEKGEL